MKKINVLIIGAGPAGLTAAYELSKDKTYNVTILEKLENIGGIARTINYKGNRMDLGGHRFFTKSQIVKKIWTDILPVQGFPSKDDMLTGNNLKIKYSKDGPDPEKEDRVMLIRKRISRIYYDKNFFDYPVSLSYNTIRNLGIYRILKIGLSYFKSTLFPIRPEKNLEDFFINRFGKELYRTFFENYTEKVWGVKCSAIKPEWGAQRIKGLSITSLLKDIIMNNLFSRNAQKKKVETTLIREFYYPKYGPGQMWEQICGIVEKNGGKLLKNMNVIGLEVKGDRIEAVIAINSANGAKIKIDCDYVISSMAVKDLVKALSHKDSEIEKISNNLIYRDFIAVGVLVKKMKILNKSKEKTVNNIIPDNWIYLQDQGIIAGRLQIFNNWSPYLLADMNTVWLGVEYFCNENDKLWNLNKMEMLKLAVDDLTKLGIIDEADFIDGTVEKVEKAYPAYFGSYDNFETVRGYLDKIENLYLIGRNGMHRYNNMDHSMLSAVEAVRCIVNKKKSKESIWQVNTESEYQES